MDIQFKGTRYEPTPEIIEQATRQIAPLARFLGKDFTVAKAYVELERAVGGKNNGDIWRAELNIDHEGRRYRAESTKAKLDHAVTTVARDVAQELRRARSKDQDLFRKGSSAVKGFLRGFRK